MRRIEETIGDPYKTAFNFVESIKWQVEAAKLRAYAGGPPMIVINLTEAFLTRMATQAAKVGEA